MALVVETGAGIATANAYMSAADADQYFTDRQNAAWTGAQAVKEAAIIRATQYLDAHYRKYFKGLRMFGAQALEWPRVGVADDAGFWNLNACVPADLKSACAELALRALSGDLEPDQDRGGLIQSVNAGGIQVQYAPGAPGRVTFPFIDEILSRILDFSAGVAAKVTRL